METIRWGVLGCGKIARKFAEGLCSAEGCTLAACAARELATAKTFAAEVGTAAAGPDGVRALEGYDALYDCAEVDAIYIATPHVFHHEQALAALQAGKAVLCEKPICTDAAQARALAAEAEARGVFLMEAMWTRFFPLMAAVRELVATRAIGELRYVQADFGFRCGGDPASRLMNPDLAGGGLLDVGVYPLSLFQMLLGAPATVQGSAHLGATGVDEQAAWVLGYAGGALAVGSCAVRTQTPHEAWICGSEGRIHIHSSWWKPEALTLYRPGAEPEERRYPVKGNGYEYEAEAVADCLRQGLREHPVMPWADSIALQETMDALRAQWGLIYPWEAKA